MSDKFLFEELNTLQEYEAITDKKYPFIDNNLNPKLTLRDYQKQAFNRFYFYYEGDKKPKKNIHLAYHMATGSGKTVIMAGLILYLYEKGYRNFLFFVNREQIVEKTKDNFINQFSSKYLFNDKITINNKSVKLKSVDNFAYSGHDGINICFTTIQGLFSDFHNEKENSLTIEDFRENKDNSKENKIALIADEAHHLSATTRGQTDLLKPSWENTVEKIFKTNDDNILLEFSATIELDNKEIEKKYLDKIIYQYNLKKFVKDGFSKNISLFKSDTDKKTRILQALIVSIYREQIAIKHALNIKPVVLLKSSKIKESIENQQLFHTLIDSLKIGDLEDIKKQTDIEILQQAFKFFDTQNIGLNLLIEKIKIAFDEKKCLCTNSDKELKLNQKRLNNLEDKDNSIRAIFTVDKLNEGWDVLNLFDIVRLNEGQGRGGGTAKISKKTISEAQLVGRGARYCPFKIKNDDNFYTRKFDNDIKNELRILEELYFHSESTHQYISEIKEALIKEGLLNEKDNEPIELKLQLKKQIKNSGRFKNKVIFKNKRIIKKYNHIKNIHDFGIKKSNFSYELASGKGSLLEIFDDNSEQKNNKKTNVRNLLELLGVNILKNAFLKFDTFAFANLKIPFPNLKSINNFLSEDYLGKFEIDIIGNVSNISTKNKLNIAISFLNALEAEIKGNITDFEGTKEFEPHSANKIFNEKTLLIPKNKEKKIQKTTHDWFIFEKFYGTGEEEKLIELIAKIIDDIKVNYQDVYLIRNERHFALYDFKEGKRFEPDFILLNKNKDTRCNYQFFIEPKGGQLQKYEQWKEDFLLEIEQNYRALTGIKKATTYSNDEYKIIGLEFYDYNDENLFKNSLLSKMDISE